MAGAPRRGRDGAISPTADFLNELCADLSAQIERMERFCTELKVPGDALVHTHNSAATVRLTEKRCAMVRVGAACYGMRTSREFQNPAEFSNR